jgi:1-acyl-sn-glycerol-3-phosphate acyltransferase
VSKPRKMREKKSLGWHTAVSIVKPTLVTFTRHEWIDGDKLPADGGCVIALNHISHVDPLTLAHIMHDHGRLPRFLAKSGLFDVTFLGAVMKNTGQIPVARMTSDAVSAYSAAVQAVKDGKAVVFYPEGTITRDPDLWPMVGKTGAARVALESGAPLVPMAQWGPHEILAPYAKRPHLLPRRTVRVKVGDPVDLDDLRGRPVTAELLHEATERVMDAITHLLEDLRGEKAPAERFDPRKRGISQIGNPRLHRKAQ